MRPAEYTDEQILEAAQHLIENGRRVTGFALRERVGGGNPSRLKQVWDEHVARQSVAANEPVIDLPHEVAEEIERVSRELNDRLLKLATTLNDKAVKAADRRVADVVRAAGEQREQAERELADAALTVEELDQALARARDEREALEHTLNDFRQGRQEMAIEIATLKERLLAAEKQASAAAANHSTEMQQMSERCAQLERALIDEKQRAGAEIESLHTQITEISVKAAKDEEHFAEHRKRAATEAHRCAEMLTTAKSARDAAIKETREAREALARQAGKLEALSAQNKELLAAVRTGGK